MSRYHMILAILNRSFEKEYVSLCSHYRITKMTMMLGNGTASKSILDYLGVENNEKAVFQSVVAAANVSRLFTGLVSNMGINLPGTGIAMSIPLESIAGASSKKYLTEGQESKEGEETKMGDNTYSLIVVICEKGCSDMVMDAARGAGARGGTVVHAKGTGTAETAKFFGVSITPEKEMIYIAAQKTGKDDIMRAIMTEAGATTKAKAIVFSLPVEDIVGLTTIINDEESQNL